MLPKLKTHFRIGHRPSTLAWACLCLLVGLWSVTTRSLETEPHQSPSDEARAQETIVADHVRIQWLAPEQFGTEPPHATIGIYFDVEDEWHVYWRNAGDSGAAPRFAFQGQGISVGEPLWPYPARLPMAHLTNLGYEGAVAYLFELDHTQEAGDHLSLSVDLEWLVCKEDCIPGFATLTLDRPVQYGASDWRKEIQETLRHFQRRVPQPANEGSWPTARALLNTEHSQLILQFDGQPDQDLQAYPKDGNFLNAAAPTLELTNSGFSFTFLTLPGVAPPTHTGFVMVSGQKAWAYNDLPIEQATAAPEQIDSPVTNLALLLLLAFAGGVILNLMPCVFPVLSIKLFSLVRASGPDAATERVREGVLYTAGVLTTFALLGGLFLLLRASGAAIGWGFQLQSPLVVFALILLFWLMALSFMGLFTFGNALVNLSGKVQGSSSFLTGILAVFVAAPCTGPFMGAALGASATLPASAAMAIFLGLGAGLAAPFLLLALSPRLSGLLPKPGPWMESLKQFLAFPLFATVLWLLWVLSHLVSSEAWLIGATVLLLLSFALWLAQSPRRLNKGVAWLIALLSIFVGGQRLTIIDSEPSLVSPTQSQWLPFEPEQIELARAEGRPVFIDFTAAWCITCQVNKVRVLDTAPVNDLFQREGVLSVRADWTRYDPVITEALAQLNRNSVPVYVFYPADGGPYKLLPQILTEDLIFRLF